MPWKAKLCSDVVKKPVVSLWPGYLPRGKLAVLDGDPEMGKSLLAMDLIARLSRGAPLPDGSPPVAPSTSILLSVEDDEADTIRPRAEAARADLSRLVVPDFGGRAPSFPDDIPALEELIRERAAVLVVVDPLMAFLPPRVAANLDQCVRQALTPLSEMAMRTGCAVLLVRHLTKGGRDRAMYRGQGSVGIIAAVRTAWYVGARPGVPGDRVLTVAKSNMGIRPPGLVYRLADTPAGQPVIEWAGPVDVTADQVSRAKPPVELRARDRACDWLRRELAGGPRRAAELYAAAAEAAIPEATLNRAKAALRVQSHRHHNRKAGHGEWWWYDPSAPWPKNAPFDKPDPLSPLNLEDLYG